MPEQPKKKTKIIPGRTFRFVGYGINDDFIMSKIRSVKEDHVIVVQPLNPNGREEWEAFNLFEVKIDRILEVKDAD